MAARRRCLRHHDRPRGAFVTRTKVAAMAAATVAAAALAATAALAQQGKEKLARSSQICAVCTLPLPCNRSSSIIPRCSLPTSATMAVAAVMFAVAETVSVAAAAAVQSARKPRTPQQSSRPHAQLVALHSGTWQEATFALAAARARTPHRARAHGVGNARRQEAAFQQS